MDINDVGKRVAHIAEEVATASIGAVAGFHAGRRVDPEGGFVGAVAGATVGKAVQEVIKLVVDSGQAQPESRVRALLEERMNLVYLVRGKDDGREAWHYVLIDAPKLAGFRRGLATGSLDVSEYGKILYSGWGQDPPPNVVGAINAEFSV